MKHLKSLFANPLVILALLLCFLGSSLTLVGCTMQHVTDSAAVTGDVFMLSNQVDDLQASLGQYAENQDVQADIDALQADFRAALSGDITKLGLRNYFARSEVMYVAIKEEAVRRWDEISATERQDLVALETHYLTIRASIAQIEEEVQRSEVINQTAKDLLSFVVTIANTYATYKEFNP